MFSELKKVIQSRALQFPQYCQKLAKICIENVFMCFYLYCVGELVTGIHVLDWKIWSVSGRVNIDVFVPCLDFIL